MNGNFAPMFLQRRPKDAGLPVDGHGIPSKVRDDQVAAAAERFYMSSVRSLVRWAAYCFCTRQRT